MAAGVSRTAGLGHLLPKSFGIVGAGQVGTGIAELACIMGLGNIVLLDQRTEALKQVQRPHAHSVGFAATLRAAADPG